jgi:muramoyltetrapeptide carboxypeptidase
MKRREALKAIALFPFLIRPMLGGETPNTTIPRNKIIKPKRLKEGDSIAVIAPASGVSDSDFEEALENLNNLGFNPKVGKYARGGSGFLSGTDEERLHDLHWAFQNKEIKGIWCVRGGYGTTRILQKINYRLIKKNPKVLIGFSDITALHLAIFQQTGLVTFHGPVATSNFTDYSKTHVVNTLMNPTKRYEIDLPEPPEGEDGELYKATVIRKGKCRGRLIGGNLSLLAAVAGTQYQIKRTKGSILFIEDVNEPLYKVDRLLTQLRQSINMRGFEGIAIGVFTNGGGDSSESYTKGVNEVFQERLGDLRIPVISGLSFGHIRDQFTLPLGIKAELNTDKSRITFLESAVA